MSPRPSNVGWYAVAKDRGRTVLAVGPLDASDAHRAVDSLRPHGPAFATYGVIRLTVSPDKALPVHRLPGECHAATSGEGYWTCDVTGGCGDCRTLAVEIDDVDQVTAWNAERRAAA